MIAIIDYDAGNIKSVEKAFQYIGEDTVVSRDKDVILSADKVVLPGVGSFGDAMEKLRDYDLIDTINKVVENNTPFLGICLGLQLLFESSDETPGVEGLGILKGKILRISDKPGFKIPHMDGTLWNLLITEDYLKALKNSLMFICTFIYLEAEDEQIVKASTDYVTHIHASVESGNVFACQFHPEKSGDVGLQI